MRESELRAIFSGITGPHCATAACSCFTTPMALRRSKNAEFLWRATYVAYLLKLSGVAARSSYRVVSRLSRQASRQVGQISIWAVVLVMCLGLPRFLVVCTGPHCHGSIEFEHASGSCCEDQHEVVGCGSNEHEHHDDGDCGDGDSAEPSRCGCTDVAFSIAEGPLPERITFEFGDSPAADVVDSWLAYTPSAQPAPVLPPATGPPRTDQRTDLLSTTLLLI